MPDTQPRTSVAGAIKLSQDMAVLVNNPNGSDVRFLVGGGDTDDETRNNAEPVTMYGHSQILRCRSKYFETLFSHDWKEKTSGIFCKPNISHDAFHALLRYIYTGSAEVSDKTILLDLIAAAEEMDLVELSVECQANVMEVLKQVTKEDDDESRIPERLPFNLALSKLIIPGLILAHQHTLHKFFQELLDLTLVHMETILESTVILLTFFDKIPPKLFKQILASDSLPLAEFKVWNLALDWACHHTKVLKPMVESQVKMNFTNKIDEDTRSETASSNVASDADAEGIDQPLISDQQLMALDAALRPLTPAIRFTLFDPEQFAHSVETLTFFLPVRRAMEIQRFFSQPNNTPTDPPRMKNKDKSGFSSDIANRESSTLLKKWIIEANGIAGCNSPENLRFKKLYQGSVNGFQVSTFHQRCDNQGPTLVLVKGSDGHLFGGVNFNSWKSGDGEWVQSSTNFLFALKDGQHRQQPVKFTIAYPSHGSYNHESCGPSFGGGFDMHICDRANSSLESCSNFPGSYRGTGASETALAGSKYFVVSDYEVLSISKGDGQ